ncbi:MAG TPA: tetratricopeptide repeat protein [Acidimicrobiales bacterium]|jgi:putative thioredoxin|nr:tetratricopeptide repeat protein [Acidimicrobiales bacterium]
MDVTDATFEQDVLERSTQATVIVDLWAEWCGPCKQLGPIIEKVVEESGGRAVLAKVDVDANPRVAQSFQVQSIPAVYAVRDRKVVDGFIGALPESQVRAFVDAVAPAASEADVLAARGDETSLRAALDLEHDHPAAVVALAELLAERGDGEEALELLGRIPETAETRRIAALARVGADEGDDEIERELQELLDRVKSDDAARQRFVDLLEVLGPEDPRTARYRKQLTARLF